MNVWLPAFSLAMVLAVVFTPQANAGDGSVTVRESKLPELEESVTSFGAAVAKGKLLVYGGHTGHAHSYSTAEQSNQFLSLDLAKPIQWTKLPSGPRLQGLALVPYKNSVIRIGGFTAKNAEGEEHDLQSQATVAKFDLETGKWSELAPLPEPRSSHEAAVVGSKVYVVGGWALSGGDGQTQWHSTAWSMDLNDQNPQWKPIADPNFQRRAAAVVQHDDKVYLIGGMDSKSGPSTATEIYDPKTDTWTHGPKLDGDSMTGFGCAARSIAGQLYVSTISGTVQRLTKDGKKFEVVGKLDPGRFFHHMLPIDANKLVLVGGANMSIGKFTELDIIEIK